jgi:4-hydroxy-tetrahydrodipicolinate synthase
MPNDLLAELAQRHDVIRYVKQANAANLAPIDGLGIYAGDDNMLADVLELGEPGGICVASHIVGDRMRQMVDEPDRRREIDAELHDVYETLFLTSSPTPVKAALNMLGHRVGGLRLPLVEASDEEAAQVRDMLERHGLLSTAGA